MSRKHAFLAVTLGAIGTLQAQEAPQGSAIAATRAWLEQPAAARARQIPDVKLSGADAATAVQMVFDRLRDEARAARADELATTDGARR
ncbi:MAG: hypothetical protein VYA51_13700, partial [Planctomycetota bacterium]|nr:hypothetical protein [Planctomycetota bacterium]